MLFLSEADESYGDACIYLVCASKDGDFFDINDRLLKQCLESATLLPISSIYEIVRNKEPFISYDGGSIYFEDYDNSYKYIAIKQLLPPGKYQRGDIVLSFVIATSLPGWFFGSSHVALALQHATNPAHETKLDLLRLLEQQEQEKKKALKAVKTAEVKKEEQKQRDEIAKIQREEEQRKADERENRMEQARLERENEALKNRLEIENRAEEEKNRILAERLRIQQVALEEEARLTGEILEMREKIERQDLEATNKTVEVIRDIFKYPTGESK